MSHEPTGLALYDKTAQDAADAVIAAYSTSFGLATRLLGPRPRPHVRNIYALVRIADEIVDGPAAAAGLDPAAERADPGRSRGRDLRRDRAGLQLQPRGPRVRPHRAGVRHRRAAHRTVLRLDAHRSAHRTTRRGLSRRLRLRLGRGRRAHVPAGVRERRGAASGRPRPRSSSTARAASARRSRTSTSCATCTTTRMRSAATTWASRPGRPAASRCSTASTAIWPPRRP